MVSTRQGTKTRESAKELSSPADSGDEYEERTPEPTKTRGTKRARSSKATAKDKQEESRRKRAKLSMLPDMPIDILYDIFSLVHPRDLMRISWTSRILNEFLTSKSSRHVWQASFQTIAESEKPPRCPSGITEMGYANLLYGQCCMNCANANPPIAAWCALIRICGPCVEEIAIDLSSTRPNNLIYGTDMSEILPTFRVKYRYRGVVDKALRSDSERFNKELAAAGESSRDNVVNKWKSLVRERVEFSDVMLKLERLAEKSKEDARADIQRRRIERIWERLSEEGWRDEISARKSEYESGIMEIKGVVMNRPLGEKAWAELRGPLNKFMREKRECIRAKLDDERCRFRIHKIKKIVYSFRLSVPHPHDFSPLTADVCWIPEVRKAIVDGTDKEFQDCKADIRSRISELSATWLEERRNVFLKLLPQKSPSLEHLSLATTLFDCIKCHESGMRIGGALLHKCLYRHNDRFFAKFSSDVIANAFCDDVGAPWTSGVAEYKYSANLSALVREIVVECGENPDTITAREMDRKHHRFVRFGAGGAAITVLSWREALKQKSIPGSDIPCRFLRPDELPEYVPDPENLGEDWGCLRCWGTGKSEWYRKRLGVINHHLARSHQIVNPTEEDYFHYDPDHVTTFKYRPIKNA